MNIDYHALAPEIILALTVVAVLVVDLLPVEKFWTAVVGLGGLFLSFIPVLTLGFCESLEFCDDTGVRVLFGDSYVVDTFSLVLKGVFLGGAFISILLSVGYLESDRFWQGEYYFLLLSSALGAVVLASSRDLITLFVGLELVTGPTFLMAGWRKGDARSNEAALKFFIIGVISAAILLFGMSLVYGVTGETTFTGIRLASAGIVDQPLFTMGVVFTLLGFAFKVSAVPFHFWTPDTYEGAPTPVTAYLSVVSKAAGFVGLLVLCYLAFAELRNIWGAALWILAALSMTVGNLIALKQTNVVRLLGYSSIAQGGFMLVPFGAAVTAGASPAQLEDAFFATVTYLLIYAFMNLGAFAVVIAVRNRLVTAEMDAWGGLYNYAPGLATMLAIFFLSLAGVPPLAGWFAKLVMFRSALSIGGGWAIALAVIAVLNAVIGFAYYAKVVKAAWFDPIPEAIPADELRGRSIVPSLQFALGLTVVAVVLLGFFPDVIARLGDLTTGFVSGF
ncbi:MAG: NADH-quinone oxidoreductase subunit N [Acidimicrobiia bacterium]|nr:NADH-quinone oxidoreductase subunit N [Acidimicrobiia bacterium]